MSDDAQLVKRLLAGLRYPAIPEHLAERIDAAIAVEAGIRVGGGAMSRVAVRPTSGPALARQAADARAESMLLREDLSNVAGLVVETEHAIATTMDKLAAQNPDHRELLGELSRAARLGAAQATELA